MELQVKDEYLARVESIYHLAVESVLTERAETHKRLLDRTFGECTDESPFLLSSAIEKRFIELIAVDMRQQVENLSKSYDRKMAEVKAQLDTAFISKPPEPSESATQKLVEGLCGQPINAQK